MWLPGGTQVDSQFLAEFGFMTVLDSVGIPPRGRSLSIPVDQAVSWLPTS